MKIKIKENFFFIIFFLIMILIGYAFFTRKNPYRIDCGKSTQGFKILFVYTQACPHCHKDWKNINKLNLADKVYMIDASDKRCKPIIEAYSDYIIKHINSNFPSAPAGIFTPTKVCLSNNKTYIGEQKLEDLKNFIETC